MLTTNYQNLPFHNNYYFRPTDFTPVSALEFCGDTAYIEKMKGFKDHRIEVKKANTLSEKIDYWASLFFEYLFPQDPALVLWNLADAVDKGDLNKIARAIELGQMEKIQSHHFNTHVFARTVYKKLFDMTQYIIQEKGNLIPDSSIEWFFSHALADKNEKTLAYLFENKLVKSSSRIAREAIQHGYEDLLRYFLKDETNSHLLKEALVSASVHGRLNSVRYLNECHLISPEAKHEAFVAGATSGKIDILTYFDPKKIPQDILEKALKEAAKKNQRESISYLTSFATNLENVNNEILEIAASQSHKELAIDMLKKGANPLLSQEVADYLVKIGHFPPLPDQVELKKLNPEMKRRLFQAYLENHSYSPELSQLVNLYIGSMSSPQQFSLFEKILVQHRIDEASITSLVKIFPSFNEQEKFQLMRIALLKNDPADLYDSLMNRIKEYLSSESCSNLEEIKQELLTKDVENQQLKERILEAFQQCQQPNVDESEIRKKIEQYADIILQIKDRDDKKDVPGVTYIGGTQKLMAIINEIPDIIFKFGHGDSAFKTAKELCEKENLPNLRVPQSVYVEELKGQSIKFTAIEKLKVITNYILHSERLRFMNRDPELQEIANEYYRQITTFIAKTGLSDTKPWNVPLLEDGSGFALLDLDSQGYHLSSGLYTFQETKNLISHVEECNMATISDTVMKTAPGIFTEEDIKGYEEKRRTQLKLYQKHREYQIWRGIVKSTDPVIVDESAFDGLSSSQKERAKEIIQYTNERIAKKELEDIPRKVPFSHWRVSDKSILDHLIAKKVFFMTEVNPYGHIIYC